jgi:hypothetical protein
MLRMSVIVPATDGPPHLSRCLAALATADPPPDEVIVVSEPVGAPPAMARNAGAARAGGDVLVFVDADVLVHPDALRRLRERLTADPGLTAVFGCYDDRPEAPGIVSGFRNLLHHHVHSSAAGPARTFWSGLGAVRRDVFVEAGGFDEHRFPLASVEDIEMGARLARAGNRIELDPAVQGTHLKRWTLLSMLATDVRRRGVPWTALVLSGEAAPSELNLAPRHRASAMAAVVGAGALVARRPLLALGAAGGLLALNWRFYTLVARRRGPLAGALALPLHALHHLSSVATVPAGVISHLLRLRAGPSAVA